MEARPTQRLDLRVAILLAAVAAAGGRGEPLRLTLVAPSAGDPAGRLAAARAALGSDPTSHLLVLPAFFTLGPRVPEARLLGPGDRSPEADAARALAAGAVAAADWERELRSRGRAAIFGCLEAVGPGLTSRAYGFDGRSGLKRGADQTHRATGTPWLTLGAALAPLGEPFPRLGVLLGADLEVPQAVEALATQGVDVVVALAEPGTSARDLQAMARLHRVFVVAVRWPAATGWSAVAFGPDGRRVGTPLGPRGGAMSLELEPDTARRLRARRPPARPELYQSPPGAAPRPAFQSIAPGPEPDRGGTTGSRDRPEGSKGDGGAAVDATPPGTGKGAATGTLGEDEVEGDLELPDEDEPETGTGTTGRDGRR